MILTGSEIGKQVKSGNIMIRPFDLKSVNPNSYNYHLGEELIRLKANGQVEQKIKIPPDGYQLDASTTYLGSTHEVIGSDSYVTSLIGRSSVGRLGLYLQISADLGNLGPAHKWTLELVCVQPIILYPRMAIGQVSFWVPEGEILPYQGIYTRFNRPTASLNPGLR